MPRQSVDEMWAQMLAGDYPRLSNMRRMWGALPSPPRCKLCNAPFRGPGGLVMRAIAYGPSPLNRRLCKWCIRAVSRHPGGAEIDISLLFADVRGSTALAERMAPEEYSRLLARFYVAAAEVIDEADGIVDKFVGDGAVALFIPGFAGEAHASRAIDAACALLAETGNDGGDPWVPLGAAVHTGRCYVGAVGEGDVRDFTALGDAVNASALLADQARAGELLVSSDAAAAAGLDTASLESRTLELRGREQRMDAWVVASRAGTRGSETRTPEPSTPGNS